MAGYVTQSRKTGHQADRSNAFASGANRNGQFDRLVSQTTFSYRDSGADYSSADILATKLRDNQRRVLRPHDTGHDFWTTRQWSTASWLNLKGTGNNWVNGHVYPYGIPSPVLPSFDSNYFGNLAISQSAPTRPKSSVYSLLQSVLETRILLDGIGPNESKYTFFWNPFSTFNRWLEGREWLGKSLSRGYIESVFGWIPFISDILKMCQAVIQSVDLIQQLQRDSGALVRRRFTFDEIKSTVLTPMPTNRFTFAAGSSDYSSLFSSILSNPRLGSYSTESSQKIWFSGAFMYHLAAGNGLNERLDRYKAYAQRILGLGLSPEAVWNLTPWTWLIDWQVDVTSALGASSLQRDGLVVHHGYLMRTTRVTNKATMWVTSTLSGSHHRLFHNRTFLKKERIRSTPFGFGVNPSSFSQLQWQTLAALGLLKAPNKLW